jgi:hypothetical protein
MSTELERYYRNLYLRKYNQRRRANGDRPLGTARPCANLCGRNTAKSREAYCSVACWEAGMAAVEAFVSDVRAGRRCPIHTNCFIPEAE